MPTFSEKEKERLEKLYTEIEQYLNHAKMLSDMSEKDLRNIEKRKQELKELLHTI